MQSKKEIAEEVANRINKDIKHFNGGLPENYALAWHGYVAGLYEWGVIEHYDYLSNLLPKVGTPDPILDIFQGRHDEDEDE